MSTKPKYGTLPQPWLQNQGNSGAAASQQQKASDNDEPLDPEEYESHPLEESSPKGWSFAGVPASFFVIYLPVFTHTFCTDMSTAVGCLFLYYSNAQGWTNRHNAGTFAVAMALQSSLPLIFSPPISRLSNIFGPKKTMLMCQCFSLVCLCLAFVVKEEAVFTMCVGLSALQGPALQPLRLAYINGVAPVQLRTLFLSIIALVGVFGTVLSCFVIMIYHQVLPGPAEPLLLFSLGQGMFVLDAKLDSCNVTYLVAAGLTVVGMVVTGVLLEDLDPSHDDEAPSLPGLLPSASAEGTRKSKETSFLKHIVSYFGLLVVLVWLVNGLVGVIVIPTLVDESQFEAPDVALVGFAMALLSMGPPIVITMFPNWKDRNVMLAAILAMMFGVIVLSAGPWNWMQVVSGVIVVGHATIYFYMASMSVYSLLATQNNETDQDGTLLKIPSLCQSGGNALGQLLGGFVLFYWVQSYWMALLLVPCVLVFAAITFPWFWARLDPPYGVPWLSNEDALEDEDGNLSDDSQGSNEPPLFRKSNKWFLKSGIREPRNTNSY